MIPRRDREGEPIRAERFSPGHVQTMSDLVGRDGIE